MKNLLGLLALTMAVIGFSTQPQAFELQAEAYVVGDAETGRILLERNSRSQIAPASLTKMMTLYLLFEALENNELSLESRLSVSEKAWRKGGSKMFVEVGKMVPVEKLIQGITVSSGNDACIVVAERLGGTVDGFASLMNAQARELGMTDTTFKNASGWPMPGHVTTALDMFRLARALVNDFPQFYPYFSQRSFTYSGITQYNRNGLLRRNVGVDGIKTGHTEEAGYHLVASAERSNLRLISVVMGADSMRSREGEALKGLSWAFGRYKAHRVAEEGEVITENASVVYGLKDTVKLVAGKTEHMLLSATERDSLDKELQYNKPLEAPLVTGEQVGQVVFSAPGAAPVSVPLLVGEDIGEKGFFGRMYDKAMMMIFDSQ